MMFAHFELGHLVELRHPASLHLPGRAFGRAAALWEPMCSCLHLRVAGRVVEKWVSAHAVGDLVNVEGWRR